MAWTLGVFPVPAAWRVPGRVERGFRCLGVPVFRRNSDGFWSLRCSADGSGGESVVLEEKKDVAVHAGSSSSHLNAADVLLADDKFRGWYGVEEEQKEKGTLRMGVMQVATGFVLALGFSLLYYVWCQKQGRKVIPTLPTFTQIQLPSFSKRSPQELEEVHDENVVEDNEDTSSRNSSRKQVEDSVQSDGGKAVQSEDAEHIHLKREQQAVEEDELIPSDESDEELQNTALVHSGWRQESLSLQDSKNSKRHGKDESQLSSSKSREIRRSQGFKQKISGRHGKVVVPAVVDRMQEQALALLQALKVVEEGSDPRAICNRRDYARWIIASSSTLTRSPSNKLFPAMYIEGVTEQAFADVNPYDPDFPYIQGIAEAGLILSKLSLVNEGFDIHDTDYEEINFFPDSPLTRRDLVSWKMTLGRRSLPPIDKEAIQAKTGFLDIDRIDSTLWPLLSDDLDSGENSIITSAFGFTRRFQPHKVVTIGQAAIALACGDTTERYGEELAMQRAKRMVDEALAADGAMVAQKQKELNELFDGQMDIERREIEQAQRCFEELKAELEHMKVERDTERDVLWKEKAAVESEKEILQHLKEQVNDRLQALTTRETQVSIEQERLKKLGSKCESLEEKLSSLMSEVEVEKEALVQARLWAENEARNARTYAEALETMRNRRASREQGPSALTVADRSWHYSAKNEIENFLHRASIQDIIDKESWGVLTRDQTEDPALLSCYLLIHWEPTSGFSICCKSKVPKFASHSIRVSSQSRGSNQEGSHRMQRWGPEAV
ncbi:uncharacterized protein [Physcomitrium patens]|uniref:SLH domain-containing protein n=1 Tax=Physcomitrium patens TaxID=3218 RepID=A0A7I4AV73_PHYPA|nr:uncharacterized protein LOC112292662 isoform X2 [Physcomitrium patens]|eukprot:XP_024397145.1 uncharacterized protein LOC112292662 isoform X2 [Physcomitrella patens]